MTGGADTEPPDSYTPTITDIGAAISILVGIAAVILWRRVRWTT